MKTKKHIFDSINGGFVFVFLRRCLFFVLHVFCFCVSPIFTCFVLVAFLSRLLDIFCRVAPWIVCTKPVIALDWFLIDTLSNKCSTWFVFYEITSYKCMSVGSWWLRRECRSVHLLDIVGKADCREYDERVQKKKVHAAFVLLYSWRSCLRKLFSQKLRVCMYKSTKSVVSIDDEVTRWQGDKVTRWQGDTL